MSVADAIRIIPRLWIGNRFAASDKDFLQTNRITSVFNCSQELPFSTHIHRQHRIAFGEDNLFQVYKIIVDYHRGEHILLHEYDTLYSCAALVTMALIVILGERSSALLPCLHSKRITIPNSFEEAIVRFETFYLEHCTHDSGPIVLQQKLNT